MLQSTVADLDTLCMLMERGHLLYQFPLDVNKKKKNVILEQWRSYDNLSVRRFYEGTVSSH